MKADNKISNKLQCFNYFSFEILCPFKFMAASAHFYTYKTVMNEGNKIVCMT